MEHGPILSRRDFLKLTALAGGAALLYGCSPKLAPTLEQPTAIPAYDWSHVPNPTLSDIENSTLPGGISRVENILEKFTSADHKEADIVLPAQTALVYTGNSVLLSQDGVKLFPYSWVCDPHTTNVVLNNSNGELPLHVSTPNPTNMEYFTSQSWNPEILGALRNDRLHAYLKSLPAGEHKWSGLFVGVYSDLKWSMLQNVVATEPTPGGEMFAYSTVCR